LEIRFRNLKVSFLIVKTVMCKRGIRELRLYSKRKLDLNSKQFELDDAEYFSSVN